MLKLDEWNSPKIVCSVVEMVNYLSIFLKDYKGNWYQYILLDMGTIPLGWRTKGFWWDHGGPSPPVLVILQNAKDIFTLASDIGKIVCRAALHQEQKGKT